MENQNNNVSNSEDLSKSDSIEQDLQLAENEFIDDNDFKQDSSVKRELLKKTRIVKQTWSIQEIYQKIKSSKIILNPDYQRNCIWKLDKQTAFIESLYMGIIVPPIYVVEIPGDNMLEDSIYEVVDGKQRLNAIYDFLTDKITLKTKSLEYFDDLFGDNTYSKIQSSFSNETNEMLSSVLDIYVITANSPEFTKYDIFSRLNKGAEKLKVNEIRKAIYRSKILDFVDSFVSEYNGGIVKELGIEYNSIFTENDIKRYEDYGRFYRSIAFYIKSNIEAEVVENYNSRPRDMINNVLQDLQNKVIKIDESELSNILIETVKLKHSFKTKLSYPDNLIDSCIPFIKYVTFDPSLISLIVDDQDIKSTFNKSAATTSNVNLRLKAVKNVVNQYMQK